jgi:polyisoprenoid-binding protein YceI
MKRLLAASLFVTSLLAGPLTAGWTLDPDRSHLAFISIKAKDVAEVHTFKEMSGVVGDDGKVAVSMMLDSVETLIPIRNERMREILFDTANYKEAVLDATVDPSLMSSMEVGDIVTITAEGKLSLHGQVQQMTLEFQAAKVAQGTVVVAAAKPLVIDASKFGLSEGVEKLREIAGLDSISNAVPVTFVMTFVDAGG